MFETVSSRLKCNRTCILLFHCHGFYWVPYVFCCSYCECFAAGVYCIEPCSCQDCFNKPIHEDTVLSTRKQIESRNPLAFAPKVIRTSEPGGAETGVSITFSLALPIPLIQVSMFNPNSNAFWLNQDEPMKTPASARHKRGCNCKKSSCLKKYCECYQVSFLLCIFHVHSIALCNLMTLNSIMKGGVGCSINCRCEGCKNAFGRKDGVPLCQLF